METVTHSTAKLLAKDIPESLTPKGDTGETVNVRVSG